MFDSGECSGIALATQTGDMPGPRQDAVDESKPRVARWARRIPGRAYRSARLVAVLLAFVCIAACQSTSVNRLNVRAEPTTASRVIGKVNSAGTSLIVECFVHGQAIYGNTVWYRISQPSSGYVSGYYVTSDDGDVAPSC